MLENYSVEAQRVVSLATTEARSLDHPHVGTEHLLLGLLADDGEPAGLLRTAGVNLTTARHKVIEALGADLGAPKNDGLGFLPYTPRAKRALERAGRFSRKGPESEVTAGHVLLGVLDVEGLACQVLRGLGVDLDHLRDAFITTPADVAVPLVDDQASIEAVRPRCPSCHVRLDDTLTETVIRAGRNGEPAANVSVAYCAACGATLGVMRPNGGKTD
ncbi:MAG: Clp protease N-terminal domain-containing protein [Ilumatobacteraceae bacterium]